MGIAVGMWGGQRALCRTNDQVVFGIVVVLATTGAALSVVNGIAQLV